MAKIVDSEKNKKLYQCEECGFHYESREWAEKCEAWCREHKSCNIEITAHAEENKRPESEIWRCKLNRELVDIGKVNIN